MEMVVFFEDYKMARTLERRLGHFIVSLWAVEQEPPREGQFPLNFRAEAKQIHQWKLVTGQDIIYIQFDTW